MCLILKKTEAVLMTADKDFIVYKIVLRSHFANDEDEAESEQVSSMHQDFTYDANKMETMITDLYLGFGRSIFYDDQAHKAYNEASSYDLVNIRQGFHFAMKKERLTASALGELAEFIVPKGSKYYVDRTGLGVANQIIFTGRTFPKL